MKVVRPMTLSLKHEKSYLITNFLIIYYSYIL